MVAETAGQSADLAEQAVRAASGLLGVLAPDHRLAQHPRPDVPERLGRKRRARRPHDRESGERLIGIEAKINQYAHGERFIAEVERIGGGPDALDPVWRGASWLPTMAEIREPEEWLDRVRLSDELVG